MKTRLLAAIFVTSAILGALYSTQLLAQSASNVPTLPVLDDSYVLYPSLKPVSAILLNMVDGPSGILDAVRKAAKDPSWNCLSSKIYDVEVVDKSLKHLRDVPIAGVNPVGNGPGNIPLTSCDGSGLPGSLHVILGAQVAKTEQVRVSIFQDEAHKKLLAQSDGKLTLSSAAQFSFMAAPQAAPGESLTNGKTRTVGQLSVSIAETNLSAKSPFNIYFKSADLFSTDEKDTKSAFAATLGAQRGFLSRFYSPIHLEETLQGNQIASNFSAVTSLGVTTLLPWGWSRKILNNNVIAAPLPPDLTLANLYTRRINQLVTAKSPLLSQNDYSLNPSLSWSSITVPGLCNAIARKPAPKVTPKFGYCVGLAIDLGLWYLPLDLTTAKTQKEEGYGDATILIPLTDFTFASKLFPYMVSSDPAKTQISIKYADSVNAANNFARTRGWTFGFVVLK